ncbi:MAG: glycosyltransferase family 2 protein [Fimbriimonadaceae bacterium]|nr:glycosyltransferase family 2 protein [Fimbriimonadaceae bacterium]
MLSILIVNWRTKDKLVCCLDSIRRHPPQEPFETIVVDNDSGDGSAEMVETDHPEVRLIRSGGNLGYAAGNNLAFSAAQGDLLLTLNPDTEFIDDSLQRAIDGLRAHPEWGIVGIRLLWPDGRTQRQVRGFPTVWGVLGEALRIDRLRPDSVWASWSLPRFNHEETGPAPQPMGTFLLFRRTALEAVGSPKRPFDEAFPIFFNEVDLLKRLHDAGHPCGLIAEAVCLHHHGSSTRQVRPAMIWESHRSLVRYLRKHERGPTRLLLPLMAVLSSTAALVRAKGFHAGFRPEHHHLQLEHDQ